MADKQVLTKHNIQVILFLKHYRLSLKCEISLECKVRNLFRKKSRRKNWHLSLLRVRKFTVIG